MRKVLTLAAVAALGLLGATAAFAEPGGDFGHGQACSGQTADGPNDPVKNYNHPGGGPVGVATTGGVGVEIGQDCRGSATDVGRLSVSGGGVYGEDYTNGDLFADAVRLLPSGITPADPNCPPGNDCDAVLIHP